MTGFTKFFEAHVTVKSSPVATKTLFEVIVQYGFVVFAGLVGGGMVPHATPREREPKYPKAGEMPFAVCQLASPDWVCAVKKFDPCPPKFMCPFDRKNSSSSLTARPFELIVRSGPEQNA